jgi:hypothetical protein
LTKSLAAQAFKGLTRLLGGKYCAAIDKIWLGSGILAEGAGCLMLNHNVRAFLPGVGRGEIHVVFGVKH